MARTPAPRPPAKPPANSPPQADSQVLSAQWIGPLPPPGALAQFNQIIPDGANRIMAMVEHEQAHRIAHESKELDATVSDFRRGHWIGGRLGALSIAGAAFTAYIGAHPTVSIALVGLPLMAIIRNIITRK